MAATQRALLEQLMASEATEGPSSIHDSRVCRAFCVDFCIHDVFAGTKYQIGECPRIHSERLRRQYGSEGPLQQFEGAFRQQLERVIQERDRRIYEATEKLEDTTGNEAELVAVGTKLYELEKNVELGAAEIDCLGQAGLISQAVRQLEALRKTQSQLEAPKKEFDTLCDSMGFSAHQKLQVCQVCGSLLSSLDTDKRLAHHFTGKLHMGYERVRQAWENLEQARTAG